MRNPLIFVIILIFSLFTFVSCAFAEEGALFHVKGSMGEAWIFGSIHIGVPEMYPFTDKVISSAESADYWVFECDTADPESIRIVQAMMYYPQNDSLKNHLSLEAHQLLLSVAKENGLDTDKLLRLKPWALTSMFTSEVIAAQLKLASAAQSLSLGVEAQLLPLHKDQKLLYLETPVEQAQMLASFSAPLQEYLLTDCLNSLINPNEVSSTLSSWPIWWLEGNLTAFSDAFLQEMSLVPSNEMAREYRNTTLTRRNAAMAEKIADWVNTTSGTYFITVGIMHLAYGEDNLPQLLKTKGLEIEFQ